MSGLKKMEKAIARKEDMIKEDRCVNTAKFVFKAIAENIDDLPLNSLEIADKPKLKEKFTKVIVKIVDETGNHMSENGGLVNDTSRIFQAMNSVVHELSWRIPQFIQGLKEAIIEYETKSDPDSIELKKLMDAVRERYPANFADVEKPVEAVDKEAIAPEVKE